MHLGTKPAASIAAHTAVAELARRGVTPVDNPLTALAELAGEIVAVKDIFRERVAALDSESWRYNGQGAEQLRAEITLYERALDRSVSVLANIAKLRIDERLARITEDQAQAVVRLMTNVAARLGFDLEDPVIRDAVLDELGKVQT
ncbi:hypothetical protein [Parafrankia sp. EUN1f]|uniref:hypothetical protein n=1 Tax=Parafrankia sp. EUN1f TaxID=102897 RepID=UPI00067FE565|nr:hypothetical protein [Parafrankia sp. EUN1f]